MRKIEICCSSVADALEAQAGGAVRVELCSALGLGGLTPSHGVIKGVLERCPELRVHVLIRPREGDFLYSPLEAETMTEEILRCRELGVHGVVVGALTADGEVDTALLARLKEAAGPLSVTFHRAFDVCRDPYKALEAIIAAGCDRLLTSGCRPSAVEGADTIAALVARAAGRLSVMPGCGVRPSNIADLERITGATEFHSSARLRTSSGMVYRSRRVVLSGDPAQEYVLSRTDRRIVLQLVDNLR